MVNGSHGQRYNSYLSYSPQGARLILEGLHKTELSFKNGAKRNEF
jgi:hypothetical protein